MDQPYPTYQAVYNQGNPSLNAANLLNNAAILNRVCPQCAQGQQPGGFTAISPEIANPPPPNFLDQPGGGMDTEASANPALYQNNLPMEYLNGFIRTQIGRRVRVEFLVGTNTITDRTGILVAVGANYILINETETDDLLACDFYNIKFIKFYY